MEVLVLAVLGLAAEVFWVLPPTLSELVVNGSVIILELFGVGLVVQCHMPLANAQAWPSLAMPYGSV